MLQNKKLTFAENFNQYFKIILHLDLYLLN